MTDQRKYKQYAEAREDTRELLRRNLVDAAVHLLMQEGPDALTVRRIAEELNASTKVIYSLFGGKEGLANELYLDGCDKLRHSIEAVIPTEHIRDYVTGCCWAYWDFAMTHPGHYAVMFSNAIPQFQPNEESLQTVATAFAVLLSVLGQYQASGKLPTRDAAETIRFIWAPLHGIINLYRAQHYNEAEARHLYSMVIDALLGHLLSSR